MSRFSCFWRKYSWTAAFVAISLGPSATRAQDVTIGPAAWIFADDSTNELPKIVRSYKPDYPADLRKTAELGYVIVLRYIDAKGEGRGAQMYSTHVPFERAVEEKFFQWKVTPATRAGVTVGSWTSIAVIFNPKIANAEEPDVIPRLLAVEPAILPTGLAEPGDSLFVPVKFNLDEFGNIVGTDVATTVKERARSSVETALKKWRFAPARRGGKQVAAEVTLPVCCISLWRVAGGKYVPPQVLKAEEPVYPYVMQQFGIDARVTLEFVVDRDGAIRNPVVVESDSPAFDEPALKALLKWKFKPAEIDGVATKIIARQPIEFSMDRGGDKLFTVRDRGDQSKLPPELRYDVSAKIRGVQIPVYPYDQLLGNVRGTVQATALIGKDGRVALVKIRSADRPEFGQALTAALEGFTFDPALKDGRPAQHLINFEQKFDRQRLPDEEGDRLLNWEKKYPERIVAANTLDSPVRPLSTKRPLFPKSLLGTASSGKTMIELLIDENGRARLPRVISASDPAFGYAAVQAASCWWFRPPLQNGKPVVTRVRVPVDFSLAVPPEESADSRPSG